MRLKTRSRMPQDVQGKCLSGSGFHRNQTQAGGLGFRRQPRGLKTRGPSSPRAATSPVPGFLTPYSASRMTPTEESKHYPNTEVPFLGRFMEGYPLFGPW